MSQKSATGCVYTRVSTALVIPVLPALCSRHPEPCLARRLRCASSCNSALPRPVLTQTHILKHFCDTLVSCVCDAGFTGRLHYTGGPCEACAAGKFKTSQGEASCADCGPSAYWPVGADPAFFQCEACPGNSTRLTDLANGMLGCICDAGYTRTNNTCALCPAGSYCPDQYQQLSCPAHCYSSAGHLKHRSCTQKAAATTRRLHAYACEGADENSWQSRLHALCAIHTGSRRHGTSGRERNSKKFRQ